MRINIILLPKPIGQDPALQSVSRRRSWKRPSYPVLEIRQISVTSISTSESFCGLYVAHPSCRSVVVWVCCADTRPALPTVMRACGGASAHTDSQWRDVWRPPRLIYRPVVSLQTLSAGRHRPLSSAPSFCLKCHQHSLQFQRWRGFSLLGSDKKSNFLRFSSEWSTKRKQNWKILQVPGYIHVLFLWLHIIIQTVIKFSVY